jgi:hypothetical protein
MFSLNIFLPLPLNTVGPVTEGGTRRAPGGLEGDGRGSTRLVALEGNNQGRRLWRILASRGIVKARSAQTRPFRSSPPSSVTISRLAAANDGFRFRFQ